MHKITWRVWGWLARLSLFGSVNMAVGVDLTNVSSCVRKRGDLTMRHDNINNLAILARMPDDNTSREVGQTDYP